MTTIAGGGLRLWWWWCPGPCGAGCPAARDGAARAGWTARSSRVLDRGCRGPGDAAGTDRSSRAGRAAGGGRLAGTGCSAGASRARRSDVARGAALAGVGGGARGPGDVGRGADDRSGGEAAAGSAPRRSSGGGGNHADGAKYRDDQGRPADTIRFHARGVVSRNRLCRCNGCVGYFKRGGVGGCAARCRERDRRR